MTEYTIDDLVPVGRLTTVRDDGFIRFIADESIERATEVFLIFPDHRVFLVTICDRKQYGGKDFVRFEEPEVSGEVRSVRQARVMLPPDEMQAASTPDLIGWHVTDGAGQCGEVTGMFYNGAHQVLNVRLADDRIIMLPWVDEWVSGRDDASRTLTVPRLGEMTEL
ncbi:MAG: hypothetical protein K8R90_04525 [Candidatus Cloacimonetes bacterium]|nr:hypothetical protein [Candidatus Cloacimonadota bacterium]